ncbi:MAG: MerC domain-containing protein [Sphingomonadales bacterium]
MRPDSTLFDRMAITLSGLCLLHCLAGVVLLSAFAVSGPWLSHNVHLVGLGLAVPLAGWALWRGFARHGQLQVLLLGAVGIVLMAVSVFVVHGAPVEVLASVAGVAMLGLAHLLNMRALRH